MNSAASNARPAAIDRESIARLVHRFYDDVRADEVLGPTFEAVLGERWPTHLPRMVEFWSTVMLGTRSFSGNVFGKHMAVPGVTPPHFRRWLALWHAHTAAAFDAATAGELQQVASGIARNLYRGYFGHAAGFDGIEAELAHATR
jgi:hemoglobin